MKRKVRAKAIVSIKRTKQGLIISASNGYQWKVKNLTPDIAITSVISNTLRKALLYEDMFSKEYIIEMKIEHKQDE